MRPTGARKVTLAVDRWFNQTVESQGKQSTWRNVLLLKTRELAHYLLRKKRSIDLSTPEYDLARQDSVEMRQKILSISYDEWEKMGFSKGTLHYLKQNAMSDKLFTINKHVRERLAKWN
ncbi:MAG: hypothetical protein APR53_07080 [Methanoculleus sp. SDB]|nr:MAG: hypothetical protein APR53_07080 [Methanoculleus sp. SDB]